MTTEKKLKKLQKSYIRLRPSPAMRASGWDVLRQCIEAEERRKIFAVRFVRYAVVAVGLVALISAASAGAVVASWRASPGDFLYPVKVFFSALQPQGLSVDTPTSSVQEIKETTVPRVPPTQVRETEKPTVQEKAKEKAENAVERAQETVEQVLPPPVEIIKIPSL